MLIWCCTLWLNGAVRNHLYSSVTGPTQFDADKEWHPLFYTLPHILLNNFGVLHSNYISQFTYHEKFHPRFPPQHTQLHNENIKNIQITYYIA
jgi:hypothetical protein